MSLARFAIGVLAVCCAGNAAPAQSAAVVPPERPAARVPSSDQSSRDTYASWVAGYKTGPLARAPGDRHEIELAVSIVDDDLALDPAAKRFAVRNDITTTLSLSTAGTVSMVRYTPDAVQGGGPGRSIPEANFKRLTELMTQLPDDHSWLPPKGRRLVVQVDTGAEAPEVLARVYDRANLPETVIEIADLIGADTWPLYYFPHFQPEVRWEEVYPANPGSPEEALGAGRQVLAGSPDQRLRAIESNPAPSLDTRVNVENLKRPPEAPYNANDWTTLRIEDAKTRAVVHEFREPMIGRYWIYVNAAQFTPDSQHLLVLSNKPDLRIYDTTTWERADSLAGIPAGAIAYAPAPDWKHGVAVFPSGEIDLMEADSGRKLAQIDLGNELKSVAYSPDGSRVAIVTVNYGSRSGFSCHLRIWDTGTGRLLRELRPQEGTPRNGFEKPIWWPDGKYLFALTRDGSSGPSIIGIWNTESGRYRGGLAGCELTPDPGIGVILEHGMFYMNCHHEMLKWNGGQALEKIADFEKSLTH